jgi:hypothetical protein
MGVAAATGGVGKQALVRVLGKFIEEALAIDNPLPSRPDYPNLGAWHEAAMASFEADEAALTRVVETYAAVLDGSLSDQRGDGAGPLQRPSPA